MKDADANVTDLTCYRLNDALGGGAPADLDGFIDIEEQRPAMSGPIDHGDFVAKLYVRAGLPHPPSWAGFISEGFGGIDSIPVTASAGAALILKLVPEGEYYALTFGTTGRFLLKPMAWQRGYGLVAALNLIYPRAAPGDGAGKLIAVDAKRRGGQTIRSRQQSSRATTFETFDVDKIRDLVGGTTGVPHEASWGRRITGGDALHFTYGGGFAGLGHRCRLVAAAHDGDDYKDRFGWLDSIRPIHDPVEGARLGEHLTTLITSSAATDLDLAPPEILDWSRIAGFQYHFEYRQPADRSDIRLTDYLDGLAQHKDLTEVDADYLRRRTIRARDADDREAYRWPVWRCLTGEFEFSGSTYVVDEGEIFEVSAGFLDRLNKYLSKLPRQDTSTWPAAKPTTKENAYNTALAAALKPALLMDEEVVRASTQTTPIEVCDVLTAGRQLIHVKRHLSSRELSHLFSQGFVSASLLQSDATFRLASHRKIKELGGTDTFGFFDVASLSTTDFEVIFAIVAPWRGRSITAALPFFSKVNLERTASDLLNRGFKVAIAQVDSTPPRKPPARASTV